MTTLLQGTIKNKILVVNTALFGTPMFIAYFLPIESFAHVVDAAWCVLNTVIRRDLHTPTVREEIRRYSSQYSARLSAYSNNLVANLTELPNNNRRLGRHLLNYLIPSVIVVFAVLVFKVWLASLIPKSHKRLLTYQLQRSATEHSST
jgi:hypothetical protein